MPNVTLPETFELTLEQAQVVLICLESPTWTVTPSAVLAGDLRKWIALQRGQQSL